MISQFGSVIKRLGFLSILAVPGGQGALAQAPQAFEFQGVARNAAGDVLSSQAIALRLSVAQTSAGGTIVYQERHTPTTNQHGHFTVNVGNGTVLIGTFATIGWGGDNHYLKVEMDPAGGTSYTDLGTTQLLSVPYALNARTSGDWSRNGTDLSNANAGNVGIGTSTPASKLDVAGLMTTDRLKIEEMSAVRRLGNYVFLNTTTLTELGGYDGCCGFDLRGEMNLTSGRFTATRAGLYEFNVTVHVGAASAGVQFYYLKVNGGVSSFATYRHFLDPPHPVLSVQLVGLVMLNPGDYVSLWTQNSLGSPVTISESAFNCHLITE